MQTPEQQAASNRLSSRRYYAAHAEERRAKQRQRSAEYKSWQAMKFRVLNSRYQHYGYYGGRGITICDDWLSDFQTFLRDMGPRPPNTTLDRVDNDGNYEPSNCRWASRRTQSLNQRPRAIPTHCRRGHLLDEANTRISQRSGWTFRQCRACGRDRQHRYRRQLLTVLLVPVQ